MFTDLRLVLKPLPGVADAPQKLEVEVSLFVEEQLKATCTRRLSLASQLEEDEISWALESHIKDPFATGRAIQAFQNLAGQGQKLRDELDIKKLLSDNSIEYQNRDLILDKIGRAHV